LTDTASRVLLLKDLISRRGPLVVKISRATLSWSQQQPVILAESFNINMNCYTGTLTATSVQNVAHKQMLRLLLTPTFAVRHDNNNANRCLPNASAKEGVFIFVCLLPR